MKRLAFALIALLAGCGGGGGSTLATPVTLPTTGASSTPSATATPPPPLAVSTQALSFSSGTAQNLTVTESGYSGAFTESDTCNPYSGEVASVVASTSSAGSATYAVTPMGAGTCAITFTDASARTATVDVTVSTAAITVQ